MKNISYIEKTLEEFEIKFNSENWCDCGGEYSSDTQRKLVKSFLTSALQGQAKEMLEKARNRVSNVLASKYEGLDRIDPKLEEMIMYCLSDKYGDESKANYITQ